MVCTVASPGFKLHVDVACIHLAGDDIAKIIQENTDIIYHLQISKPFLENIPWEGEKSPHSLFAALVNRPFLRSDVFWSIEMKDGQDNVARIQDTMNFGVKF